ncbi:MAG TPA: hypothetical protein VIW78_15210 [Burkholderiales bacterium]
MSNKKQRTLAKKPPTEAPAPRPYTAKLRAAADGVKSCMNKLRGHILGAVDAVGAWLHRGTVQIGRLSPRAAAKLQTLGNWIGRSEGRKLGAAALAAALLLGIVSTAAFSENIGRYCRVVFTFDGKVPLPGETRRAVGEKTKQLAGALESRLDRKGKLVGDAWTSAQILLALLTNDADYAKRITPSIERYFRSVAGPECACWRQLPTGRFPDHIGVTSWVLWALAAHGDRAQKAELEFLLSVQHSEGWWPLFAGAQQERFASSYATAVAILALHEQSALEPDPRRKERLAAAVQRGASWLKRSVVPGRARWLDYPAWPGAEGEFFGVSGFALFTLHRVGAADLSGLDRDWMRELPDEIPAARGREVSKKSVQVGKRAYPDDTHFYGLPWGIAATALAYPNASISGKVDALKWLERALAPGAPLYALSGKEKRAEIAAETLLALRSGLARE